MFGFALARERDQRRAEGLTNTILYTLMGLTAEVIVLLYDYYYCYYYYYYYS